MTTVFYVYALFRPWDGTPCYVGKGQGRRWMVHGYKHGCKNRRLAAIVARAGGPLPKIKLAENLSEAEAFDLETCLIRLIGRGDKGPLVNFTDGGEGTSGIEITAERRAAIGQVHRGKKLSPKHRLAFAGGRPVSDAAKEKISRANSGKKRSAATIEQMRLAARHQMMDPARKEAVARANRNRVWTDDMRRAHGLRMAQVAAEARAAQ